MTAPKVGMNNERLKEVLNRATTILSDSPGCWSVEYQDRKLVVVTDEQEDRMRIMTPVVEDFQLEEADLQVVMAANFDRALDARYAIAGGYLWSVFMHPLADLTERMLIDGIRQVRDLAHNFGRSYGSSPLVFTGGRA